MTQTAQELTTHHGYAIPQLITEADFEAPFEFAMDAAAAAYERLAEWNPHVAAYIVPNGYKRRVLFSMNLREAFAFCQLRSAANAHYSMRRVAERVAEEIRLVHPLLSKYMLLPAETWHDVENQHFTRA